MTTPYAGIYIHIPYCLQKCPYCDFAKYEIGEIPPFSEYTHLLKKEISVKAPLLKNIPIKTIYFGGGTPSLMPTEDLESLLLHLSDHLDISNCQEMTLECNPGTLSQEKVESLSKLGFNRFSIGAQTFNDKALKILGRKHNAQETRDTLKLVQNHNFTLDLMYALPGQNLELFQFDIQEALKFNPPHISLYYLTLPKHHWLNKDRPDEDLQIQMFDSLEETLSLAGLQRYEISNFAKPGYESQHNLIYWSNEEYLGFGLSAHSYLKRGPHGSRFWNPRVYEKYRQHVEGFSQKNLTQLDMGLLSNQIEILKPHEALTDYCHTALRKMVGLDFKDLSARFPKTQHLVLQILLKLQKEDLIQESSPQTFSLSLKGRRLANIVFEKLTFLPSDIAHQSLDK